jgi:multidrug efflux pump subunit AcrB
MPVIIVILAMVEVRSALIMSTIAIIFAFAPLSFITGMMGPYMAPMAFNVPLSVSMSTVVAFLVTPWLASKLLKASSGQQTTGNISESGVYRFYESSLSPLIRNPLVSWVFGAIALLFLVAMVLPLLRLVPL